MDKRNEIKTINLAGAAGLPEPEQKKYGKEAQRPRVKNRWRNHPCKCGSGKKAKRCCLPMLARAYK